MAWQFRKSKKIGPFRITASKRGFSASGGVPGARISANTRGEVRRTVGIPGSGIYSTKRLNAGGAVRAGTPVSAGSVHMTVQDATGGTRRLFEGDPGVACCSVVQLDYQPAEAAQVTGITGQPTSDKPRGIRDCLLIPSDDGQVYVALYVTPQDNPVLFAKKSLFTAADTTPKAIALGRLRVTDTRKHAGLFAGRPIKAVIFIDAEQSGTDGFQVRFRPDQIDPPGVTDNEVELGEPPAPESWWQMNRNGLIGAAVVLLVIGGCSALMDNGDAKPSPAPTSSTRIVEDLHTG